jgi:putative 4-mercaptohistidine N1-methyltranferase
MNPYESDRLLHEYLLFHYGAPDEVLPWPGGPRDALGFAVRSVTELIDAARLPPEATALDVGCAVGRSAFELSKTCASVVAIDFSRSFVEAGETLRTRGELPYRRREEGHRMTDLVARIPEGARPERVAFETGDAMDLRADLGAFDVVHAANLLCRLNDPARFLARLPDLVKPGGQLLLTTPCTWLEEFTPLGRWLCAGGKTTLDGIRARIEPAFALEATRDLPVLIREHARKYQWTVAQGTRWTRNPV